MSGSRIAGEEGDIKNYGCTGGIAPAHLRY